MRESSRFWTKTQVRRWALLIVGGSLAVGTVTGALRLKSLAEEMLPGFLHERLEAALGRPVEFGAVRVWPTGMWVEDLRVPRIAGEPADPLSARRLRVRADWWQLVWNRTLRVEAVELDDARLRIAPPAPRKGDAPWTTHVLSLSRAGVGRFGLRGASLHVYAPGSRSPLWAAEGVAGDLSVGREEFGFRGAAARVDAPGVSLARLELAGSGDGERLRIEESRASYSGGRLAARGTLRARDNAASLAMRVDDLPLSRLASGLGIPAAWAANGALTGEVAVSAADNSLRSVRGKVRVERGPEPGTGGKLPWRSASASIDWTPAATRITELRVKGPGLMLSAAGDVSIPEGKPFTAGRFQLAGDISASEAGAVARVSELLAFRQVLDGRWGAERASVRFSARGTVGELDGATAEGRLSVSGLRFRPTAKSDTVTVSELTGYIERTPERLVVRGVRASTDGFTLTGDATVTGDRAGVPGELQARGALDIEDLKSLKKAIPEAGLWKWIPVASSTAGGQVRFTLAGPTGDPSRLRSSGTFEMREFRLGTKSPLPNGAMFFIPVRTATGSFDYADRTFDIRSLKLATRKFDAQGQVTLSFQNVEPRIAVLLHVDTDDWRSLPAMPLGLMPELEGGRLQAMFKLEGEYAQISTLPVSGSFRLRDATYTPARASATGVPVRELAARFRWDEQALTLPFVSVETPLVSGTAAGRIYPVGGEYRVGLDVDAKTGDAAAMLSRFTEDVRLDGGAATARFHVDMPIEKLDQAVLAGSFEMRDARVLQRVEALGLEVVDARRLGVDFARDGSRWELARVDLTTPDFELALRGTIGERWVDSDLRLKMARWTAAADLPVTGGAVEVTGRLQGETADWRRLALAGEARLDEAGLRFAGPAGSLQGGALRLAVSGTGPISDPLKWAQSGEIRLAGARGRVREGAEVPVELSGAFRREGEWLRWSEARLNAGDTRLTSSGIWSPIRHRVQLAGEVGSLEALGFTLPEGLGFDGATLDVTVEGDPEKLLRTAAGRLGLEDLHLAVGEHRLSFERADGDFRYDGLTVKVARLEASGAAGTVDASGEWSERGHHFSLLASGEDLRRLGLALPEGFSARAYRLEGEFRGTAKAPVTSAEGSIQLRAVGVPFGPAAPHVLDLASARFSLEKQTVTLKDLLAVGPAGQLTGSGEVVPGRYRLSLASDGLDPKLAAWLVPGRMAGGKLAGTLEIAGDNEASVRSASGRFNLTNARYTLPPEVELRAEPAAVARFAGDYRWENGRTDLTRVDLESDVVSGRGALTVTDGKGKVTADLSAADLGKVADFWPVLNGKLRGGTGTGQLATTFDENGARGSIKIKGAGGTLFLPGAPEQFGSHPVDTASLVLGFEPGRLTFGDVRVRGPKGNLDGEGHWSETGPVYGKGKAWFSKQFTSALMKPTGFGWLARLIGIREIKSDFELQGSAERVTLNAGITRSFIWKFAKGRVPKEFQDVAGGKAPLWIAPVEVAEADLSD